jgi:hypothetical protein
MNVFVRAATLVGLVISIAACGTDTLSAAATAGAAKQKEAAAGKKTIADVRAKLAAAKSSRTGSS